MRNKLHQKAIQYAGQLNIKSTKLWIAINSNPNKEISPADIL